MKNRYDGLLPNEMRRLDHLEDGNSKFEKLVADLYLDKRCCRTFSAENSEARHDERPVPDFLVDHINRYLEVHRPAFKALGSALWVGRYKNPKKI